MKIKNVRIFLAGVLAFTLIGTMNSCQDYKVKEESKTGNIIQITAEDVDFEDIFTPAETEKTQEIDQEYTQIRQK